MLLLLVINLILSNVFAIEDQKIVSLSEGDVKGTKFWNGDFYEFYGIPYASVPQGRNRFKGPLPPEPWEGVYDAKVNNVGCTQKFFGHEEEEEFVYGQDDCLVLNIFSPTVANENNLLPVVVYIHSGGFAIGHGNMAKFNYLVRHDVVIVSINYRLGALGFLCLGTEEIPGNAGLKDQVAALKWVHKNIRKFGGNAKKVTVAGFSVGASMAELLSLSKLTEGLIDKIILDSGSALSPWAINGQPVETALNVARSLGYNGTNSTKTLTEFYLNVSSASVSLKSLNFYLKNGTFGFSPCIENINHETEAVLNELPIDILKKGGQQNVAVLTGFSNMEGISRVEQLESWREDMENNFADFLPTDIIFKDKATKEKVAKYIKKYYFGDKVVSNRSLKEYIDYFSDAMFTYGILNSAKMHAVTSKRPVYLYEFSYVGELSTKHRYMDEITGASHRDQTAYILDFYAWTSKFNDLDMRDRLTLMWADFIKYEDPTAYESVLVNYKWPKYSVTEPKYLSINLDVEIKENLLENNFVFWKNIYDKHH